MLHNLCTEAAVVNIVLVYNPKSGSALSKKVLQKKCNEAGIKIEKFVPIKDGFERILTPYIKSRQTIAVIGGDGTVSAVAGYVANTKATLAPLPGGTLNHFTKDLGIPQDIDKALKRLKTLKPKQIDIANVNNVSFINNSSIGLYPAALHDREDTESKLGKWPAAVVASFRALVRFKTYRVTIDGATFTTPFIFIGNNRYSLDSFGSTERSSLDEGILTVFAAKTQSRITLLKIALFTLAGNTKQLPEFDEFHPKSFTIETKRSSLSVSHDGEVSKLSSPLTYKIRTKALKILA